MTLEHKLVSQYPAEGISLTKDFGDAKYYEVQCQCWNEDDAIRFEVGFEHGQIAINHWTTQRVRASNILGRIKTALTVLFLGTVKYESTTILSEQQALNYADTIYRALREVKEYRG